MTLTQLKNSKRISAFHSAGYVGGASSNSQTVAHSYKIVYTNAAGMELVIGQGRSKSQNKARDIAFAAALAWANE